MVSDELYERIGEEEQEMIMGKIGYNEILAQEVVDVLATKIKRDNNDKWNLMKRICIFHQDIDVKKVMLLAVVKGRIDICIALYNDWFGYDRRHVLGEALLQAIKSGQYYMLSTFMDNMGVSVDYVSCNVCLGVKGITPLILSVMIGNAELVEDLVDRGADLRAVSMGGTALEYAKRYSTLKIISCLEKNASSPSSVRKKAYRLRALA